MDGLNQRRPLKRDDGTVNSLQSVSVLHKAGVTILAASDSPQVGTATGASILQELEQFFNAGLSPIEALTAATTASAHMFNLDEHASVAVGMGTDLLLVEGGRPYDLHT